MEGGQRDNCCPVPEASRPSPAAKWKGLGGRTGGAVASSLSLRDSRNRDSKSKGCEPNDQVRKPSKWLMRCYGPHEREGVVAVQP